MRKPTKARRCEVCKRALREWNKSGYCTNCATAPVGKNKGQYISVSKKKLLEIKWLIDEILEVNK